MRMLMKVKIPNDKFNTAVKSGSAGKMLNRILEEANPEAAYFTEEDGFRTALLVVNVDSPSDITRFAEPWFISLDASVEFKIVMTVDDLRRSGLDDLGRKWS